MNKLHKIEDVVQRTKKWKKYEMNLEKRKKQHCCSQVHFGFSQKAIKDNFASKSPQTLQYSALLFNFPIPKVLMIFRQHILISTRVIIYFHIIPNLLKSLNYFMGMVCRRGTFVTLFCSLCLNAAPQASTC